MLLAIDAGNSNIKLELFASPICVAHWRLTTDVRSSDEYGAEITNYLIASVSI